ncbi:hypothetical protein [Nocardiopsis sp. MG754419]|uniref:hypothetical protein n=1 Tax=Nocardiopsis sp. MG754419 TaxID=2259865 RepID=UPI001BAAD8FC|nr:hypothetical protein [Nocardiopsis sp. MG754419]MBR8740619.1 hypothetical protein [Nocardiopsis sp. MG754419]
MSEPSPRDVDTMVGNLGAGNDVLIIEGDGDHDVQVYLHRPDRFYQREYRDGGPTAHHRTFASVRAEVVTAMTGWSTGDPAWRAPFT